MFGEGVLALGADDEVIEDADIEERERRLEAPRDRLIRRAGLCSAGGAVVQEDHSSGIRLEDDARDLARMHRGALRPPSVALPR